MLSSWHWGFSSKHISWSIGVSCNVYVGNLHTDRHISRLYHLPLKKKCCYRSRNNNNCHASSSQQHCVYHNRSARISFAFVPFDASHPWSGHPQSDPFHHTFHQGQARWQEGRQLRMSLPQRHWTYQTEGEMPSNLTKQARTRRLSLAT